MVLAAARSSCRRRSRRHADDRRASHGDADGAGESELPQVLGPGVQSSRAFCDVVITRDPAEGVIIPFPRTPAP